MDIELLTIGNELLLGFTVDTNGAELARQLGEVGVRVVRRTTVGDRPEEIEAGVRGALQRTGAVITTGGLGPTRDDVTKQVVAGLFGRAIEFRPELWDALVERYRTLVGRVPTESNRSQAEAPKGATVLPNKWGSAPGLWLEGPVAGEPGGAPGLAILLPGVPREMRMLLQHEVVPRLAGRGGGTVTRSRTIRTAGIPESVLAERIGAIEEEIVPLTLAYLPSTTGVDLRVTAWDLVPAEAERRLEAAVALLESRTGAGRYGRDDADLAELVLTRARAARLTLATAESCTGGLVGARITAIPGSSESYVGGVVAYDNRIKEQLLRVPPDLLEAHGAVSEPVALAMAEGARRHVGADVAVAVTGIAGPDGGTEEKPVGTVWLAVAGPGGSSARQLRLFGNREEVRLRATEAALFDLLKALPE
jgi:nicotinamide-nucleotide amidase